MAEQAPPRQRLIQQLPQLFRGKGEAWIGNAASVLSRTPADAIAGILNLDEAVKRSFVEAELESAEHAAGVMANSVLFLRHGDVTVGFGDHYFDGAGEFKDVRDVADIFRLDPLTLTIGGMALQRESSKYASTNLRVSLGSIHESERDKGSNAGNPILLDGMAAAPPAAGLTHQQLLRHSPMPPMKYHQVSGSNSTSAYQFHPEVVVEWDMANGIALCEAIKQHTERVTPGGHYTVPGALNLEVYSSEEGLVLAILLQVISPVEELLKNETLPWTCCSATTYAGHWTPGGTRQLSDSQRDDANFIPAPHKQPNYELLQWGNGRVRSFIEVKRPEVLAPSELCTTGLAPLWSYAVGFMELKNLLEKFPRSQLQPSSRATEDAIIKASKSVKHVISQAYTYMCQGGLKYSAVTTYNSLWLLCCEEPGTLMVSKCFGLNDTEPTPREAVYWLSHMALHEEAVTNPWKDYQYQASLTGVSLPGLASGQQR